MVEGVEELGGGKGPERMWWRGGGLGREEEERVWEGVWEHLKERWRAKGVVASEASHRGKGCVS